MRSDFSLKTWTALGCYGDNVNFADHCMVRTPNTPLILLAYFDVIAIDHLVHVPLIFSCPTDHVPD